MVQIFISPYLRFANIDNGNELASNIYEEKPGNSQKKKKSKKEASIVRRFFYSIWTPMTNKLRFILIIVFLLWVGASVWRVTVLEPDVEEMEPWKTNHYMYSLKRSLLNDYHNSEDTANVMVSIIYGLDHLETGHISKWDSKTLGDLVYDDTFTVSAEANQQRILDICSELRTSSIVADGTVYCWMEDFLNSVNGGSPVPETLFNTYLETFLATTYGQAYYDKYFIGYLSKTAFL